MKIRILSILFAISFCMTFLGCSQDTGKALSASDIAELRKTYPVVTLHPTVEYPMFDLDARLAFLPYLAEIEVIEILPDYTADVRQYLGREVNETDPFASTLLCHQFEVKIHNTLINNTETALPETITICFADAFSESYPSLAVGTKLVASLEPAKGSHEGKYIFYDNTIYYITDNDYILSVYEENEDDIDLTGYTKNDFIDQISQMNADNE